MSFFKFNDEKSKKQSAIGLVYLIDTKQKNAVNRARFYASWSRTVDSRLDYVEDAIPGDK
jgi:hypothetical protein